MTKCRNIIKNFLKVNNDTDLIVYDIYEEDDEIKYFFTCQNSGFEKTISSSHIFDVFKHEFLKELKEQLKIDKKSRMSSSRFYSLVWKKTSETLGVSSKLEEHFIGSLIFLNQDLRSFDLKDIFGLFIDANIDGDSYLIYNDLHNHLNLVRKEDFLSKVQSVATEFKNKYSSQNISKKMTELNKEALNIVCKENNIKYIDSLTKQDTCNHEFKLTKKRDGLNPYFRPDEFFYQFECKHCGELKFISNYKIIELIHENSIKIIKYQLSLPNTERKFNFDIFNSSLDMLLEKENINPFFRIQYEEDYSLPKLSKEVVLITPKDLDSSGLVFTNSICKKTGLSTTEIMKDIEFVLSKKENEILFIEKEN